MTQGKIVGCSYGGVWYYPPGYTHEHQKHWFESKEKAEAYCEELRNKLKAEISNLQMRLEAV